MKIENMTAADSEAVLNRMRPFYASAAVLSDGSEEIFRRDIAECLRGSPFLEGFVFREGDRLLGYAMLAHSFSTEYGKPCVWVEDLYLDEDAREQGIGSAFLQFAAARYPEAILRLEVEPENERAVHTYRKNGFAVLPYQEMLRLP